jgi:hypothetical protein
MRYLITLSCLLFTGALFFQAKSATTDAVPPPVVAKFLDLFDRLHDAQEKTEAGEHQQVSFRLSETEVNDYLRNTLKTTPRPGVDSVTVKFLAKDYISTLTRVDFDAVERWRAGTIPTVLRPFLKGKKAISVDYRIKVADSKMTFTVEKAKYEDMALSAFFVEKMIQIIAARQPEKYDTSKPIPLPFGLTKIWTSEHNIHGQN